MAIVFDSDAGTISGISVGGLPDGVVDSDTLANNAVVTGKIADGSIVNADVNASAAIAASKLTGISSADNTPSFSAKLSSDQTTAANTYVKLQFGTENWDTDSAYDASNYKFTVPSGEAGKYLITVYVRSDGSTTYNLNYPIVLYKNGSAHDYHSSAFGSSRARHAEVYTKVLDLSVGDYLEVYSSAGSGGTTWNAQWSLFSGYKLAGV